MATKRCIPTAYYEDPDISALMDLAANAVLIALIINADDEGRNVAQAPLIARWVGMGLTPEQAEAGLQKIADNDLVVLYQVGKHRYYWLTKWNQWQSLGGRITPSKHPAPPREKAA